VAVGDDRRSHGDGSGAAVSGQRPPQAGRPAHAGTYPPVLFAAVTWARKTLASRLVVNVFEVWRPDGSRQ
jgi:hypothetical protein